MISDKKGLIWLDIKSWLITSTLMLLPAFIGEIIAMVQQMDMGPWTTIGLLILGMVLKLVQKWNQDNYYPIKQ